MFKVEGLISCRPKISFPTTCQNLRYIRKLTNIEDAEQFSSWRIRKELPQKSVPEAEKWRLGLLTKLMAMNENLYMEVEDSKRITVSSSFDMSNSFNF